jgi:membrane protease YdiL (CAAX protease family)
MQLKKTSFLWGLLVFGVTMAIFILAAAPIQMALGMWGVAITEIMFVGISIGAALLLKFPLKEVFNIRAPRVGQVIGTLLMALSGFLLVTTSTLIIFYFFPEGMEVAVGMNNLFSSVPGPISFLIIAVMPAICEELLHRGIILHTFKGWKSKWGIVFAMAFIFGVFHLDPYRFLGTAILGGFMTYIALETDNLLLPMLYHFVNNSISSLSSLITPSEAMEQATEALATTSDSMMLYSVGIYVFLSAGAVLVLRGGAALVQTKLSPRATAEERATRKNKTILSWVIAGAVSRILLVSGIALMVANMGAAMAELGLDLGL